MSRSAERVAAEEKVADALAEWREVVRKEQDDPVGMITGWVAVLAEEHYDDDGDLNIGYPICSSAHQPTHIDVGLLTIAQASFVKNITHAGD